MEKKFILDAHIEHAIWKWEGFCFLTDFNFILQKINFRILPSLYFLNQKYPDTEHEGKMPQIE